MLRSRLPRRTEIIENTFIFKINMALSKIAYHIPVFVDKRHFPSKKHPFFCKVFSQFTRICLPLMKKIRLFLAVCLLQWKNTYIPWDPFNSSYHILAFVPASGFLNACSIQVLRPPRFAHRSLQLEFRISFKKPPTGTSSRISYSKLRTPRNTLHFTTVQNNQFEYYYGGFTRKIAA